VTRAPLNAVRAFEAAARSGSFAAAAAELHVTPSAISHQIRALEAQLGVKLFERSAGAIRLSTEGADYARAIGAGLRQIEQATARLASRKTRRLAISAAPHMTSRWLLPRLHRFRALNPEVSVSLHASCQVLSPAAAGVDIALRSGLGTWEGLRAERIMGEWAVLAAAPQPGLSSRNSLNAWLDGRPQVTLSHRPSVWREWTAGAKLNLDEPAERIEFGDLLSAIDAVVAGLGVAILPWSTVADDVARGRLEVPAAAPAVPVAAPYFVVWPEHVRRTAQAESFSAWLCDEAAALSRPPNIAA
jgi:LysR family glycine cleavage system transcriptional activator